MPRRERKKRRIDPKHTVIMNEGYCICPDCGTKKKTEVDCHEVICRGCGHSMANSINYRGGKYV